MSTKYEYDISVFTSGLDSYQLLTEIQLSLPCDKVNRKNDTVKIWFDTSLDSGSIDSLNNMIAAHYPFAGEETTFQLITADDSPSVINKALVKCDTSDGNIVINLQKSKRVKNIKYLITKSVTANIVTINAYTGEYIDGWASKTLNGLNETITMCSDGKNWQILANDTPIDTTVVSSMSTVTDKKGQIIVDNGNGQQPLDLGIDGQTLIADSTQVLGVKWGAVSGGVSIFGSEFQYVESETQSSTTNYEQKVYLETISLLSGTYKISWYAEGNINSNKYSLIADIKVNGTAIGEYYKEPKDANSSQYTNITGFKCLTLSGINEISLSYGTTNKKGTASIRRARIEIYRIS
jgi:hypothetical protein